MKTVTMPSQRAKDFMGYIKGHSTTDADGNTVFNEAEIMCELDALLHKAFYSGEEFSNDNR
jgi:hypothetical protein